MKKYLAEFIGTFILVFCGTGVVIVDQLYNAGLGLLGISILWGLVVIALIYVFGPISGTHINPAVTVAVAIKQGMPKKDILFYILAQILGATLGSIALYFLFPEHKSLGTTTPSGSHLQSFLMELILTFILMLTILGATAKKENESIAGIIIGMVLIGIIMVGGPVSCASFNPARTLGPAIVSGVYDGLWIYLTAPIAGTVLAVLLWKVFESPETN